ncbi:hypothetical protein OPU71_20875 [Niveibacterium sp. 24ML]|uniref:hypothetical protein n=1 Tax=Niveibacterium sp. 24ML TaxID=2985512 RepID=UPI00226FFA61|nr:hypothetical protein [Niveibacterium sp. 24ML]MCX9158574.1 hypothetical protein [Niveibacterium sp. 24ML]
MERWEIIERRVLLAIAVLTIPVPLVRFVLGHGGAAQLLLLPVGLWASWQAIYENTEDPNRPPSAVERTAAQAWLWLRRLVCFGVAGVIVGLGVANFPPAEPKALWGLLLAVGLAFLAVWVGLFGAGNHTSLGDDREVHRQRKARYKWRL